MPFLKKTKIIIDAMIPAVLAIHFNGTFHLAAMELNRPNC
jgi:hypothetical protein